MKISLNQQLEELTEMVPVINGILGDRQRRGLIRRAEVDYRLQRMEAIRRTILWMRDNENDIRAWIEARKGASSDPSSVPHRSDGEAPAHAPPMQPAGASPPNGEPGQR